MAEKIEPTGKYQKYLNEGEFSVKVRVEFAAAHHIRGYDGDCARHHGHNWKIDVEASTRTLSAIGIAVDFKVLKSLVNALIDRYDHYDLNAIAPFDVLNPTAETMAMVFFAELNENILHAKQTQGKPLQDLRLKSVTVWENDRCAATFSKSAEMPGSFANV